MLGDASDGPGVADVVAKVPHTVDGAAVELDHGDLPAADPHPLDMWAC